MDHAGNRVMPVLGASSGVFGGTEECMVPERIKNGNILGGRRDTWAGLHGIDETRGHCCFSLKFFVVWTRRRRAVITSKSTLAKVVSESVGRAEKVCESPQLEWYVALCLGWEG